MRWEWGPVSGVSRTAPDSWYTPRALGSHLWHGNRVLARLEGSAVAQGEHSAQRPPGLRGLVKCLPWGTNVQAGCTRGLHAAPDPERWHSHIGTESSRYILDEIPSPDLCGTQPHPSYSGTSLLSRLSMESQRRLRRRFHTRLLHRPGPIWMELLSINPKPSPDSLQ